MGITKEEFDMLKKLEKIKHDNKMKQIEEEKKSHIEVENMKHQHKMSFHRLKRADIKRTLDRKDSYKPYTSGVEN